ncbi:MAG: ferric reductase-like transmembrane domain-containing protein [Deltaproteobacteria bacterium]|nr:ferric reductase-like transmembrane domain-containing protein [Deltaproteobacteria bacterium]
MKAQRSWRRLLQKLLQNRMPYVIALGGYLALCVGVCVEAVLRHSDKNAWIQVARGAAAIVYLNGALIFVPMMRHFLTHLRHRRLLRALPFDEAVSFHRLCGHVMFFAGLVHTLAHFGNNAAILETPAGKTGLALLIVFAAMWGTALAFVRKGGHFRLFYLTHFLYVAWAALAIWHGPRFWMWLSLPLVGFLIERTWRFRTTSRAVSVRAGELLPSDVLALKVEKPAGFHYAAGSYLFLKCPQVSAFEWHPFTISSAPEDDALTVHIRAVGSWTGALYRLIKRRPHDVSVYIDGPYGAPAEEIFGSERAVLIGAGIGVTPFASVLRSILARKRRGDHSLGLERVRFFWLSREQRSFEWFLQLLSAIEREDDGLFELNVYLTGAESRHDLKSATLFIAMDMLHEATKVDLITGLESKTKTGRPDWPAIFQRIAEEDKGKPPATVFFCGPAGLGRELKALCRHHGLRFRQEAF